MNRCLVASSNHIEETCGPLATGGHEGAAEPSNTVHSHPIAQTYVTSEIRGLFLKTAPVGMRWVGAAASVNRLEGLVPYGEG
jgi:hypothetical protein